MARTSCYRLALPNRKMVLLFLLSCCLLFLLRTTLFLLSRDLLYLLRPLWDSPPPIPEHLISHYYAPRTPSAELCSEHGWSPRGNSSEPQIIDVFIFSIELDMLEIRLRELWPVVDKFVLVEADKTFTGQKKPLVFTENRERFRWAEEKLVHFVARSLDSRPQKEFHNEGRLRRAITDFVHSVNPSSGDLIVTSDIDELPYAHTLALLKSCQGYPAEIHLEMRNYLYSFEFPLPTFNWKPHVTTYHRNTFWYHHGKYHSLHRLADSGWHCSFCFRHISQFVFKMTSYSHNDRVTRSKLLDKEEIQRKICQGQDIFDMLPEAYTYKELIAQIGKIPKSATTLGLPQHVVENRDKFRFLLPGGCVRDEG